MAKLISTTDWTRFEFDAVQEEIVEIDNDVTEHPVEEKGNISDHVENRPNLLTLEGVVIEEDDTILQKLLKWRNEAHLLRFRGRNVIGNLVIRELRRDVDVTIQHGFRFRATLQQIERVKPKVREIVREDPASPDPPPTTTQAQAETETQVGRFEDADRRHLNDVERSGPPLNVEHPALGGAKNSYDAALERIHEEGTLGLGL